MNGVNFWDILVNTYIIVLPIVVSTFGGYLVHVLKQMRKSKDANREGTMLLLRVQLIEYHDKYVKKGCIPSYAYENFQEMYIAYKNLGGNGMVEKMYTEVQSLHLHTESTKKEKGEVKQND